MYADRRKSGSAEGANYYQPRASPWGFLKQRKASKPMPQSLAKLHIHLIFSTKYRERLLYDGVRDDLHKYMAVVLRNFGCPCVIINSVEDHVHILFELGRTVAVSNAVEEVKKTSSKWIKTQGEEFVAFRWQGGYGAFAVSLSNVDDVREYIIGQREHHKNHPFMDEYRGFLNQHGIPFDERYVWD